MPWTNFLLSVANVCAIALSIMCLVTLFLSKREMKYMSVEWLQNLFYLSMMYMFSNCILIFSAMDTEAELSLGDSKVVETGGGGEIPSNTSQNLWVDKYAPRQYTHLLSDDVSIMFPQGVFVSYEYDLLLLERR